MVPTGDSHSPQGDSDGRIDSFRDSKWSRAIPALLLVGVITVSSLAFPLIATADVSGNEVTNFDWTTFDYRSQSVTDYSPTTDELTFTVDKESGSYSRTNWTDNPDAVRIGLSLKITGTGTNPELLAAGVSDRQLEDTAGTGFQDWALDGNGMFLFYSGGDMNLVNYAGNSQLLFTPSIDTTYYYVISVDRTADEFTVEVYSDSDLNTLVASQTMPTGAPTNDINYLYGPTSTQDTGGGNGETVSGVISGNAVESPPPTPTAIPGEERLQFQVQNVLEPNGTYPFTLYYWATEDNGQTRGERQDVTTDTNTTYDIENVTVNGTQALSLNASGDQFDTTNEEEAAVTVNVTAEYDSGTETLNTTETIVVAAPTVENLAILPTGMYRAQAVILDNTMFALIVAALLSVAASRFVNSFAGLATAEMVIVVGWLGGYIGLGIAMLSVFVAIFIGLNLAENLGIQAGGIRR